MKRTFSTALLVVLVLLTVVAIEQTDAPTATKPGATSELSSAVR